MLFLIGMLIQEHQDPRKSSRRHRPPVVVDPIDVTLVWIIKICLVVLYLTVPQLVVDATESGTATTQPDESFFFLCSGGQVKQLHDHLIQNPGKQDENETNTREMWGRQEVVWDSPASSTSHRSYFENLVMLVMKLLYLKINRVGPC